MSNGDIKGSIASRNSDDYLFARRFFAKRYQESAF